MALFAQHRSIYHESHSAIIWVCYLFAHVIAPMLATER